MDELTSRRTINALVDEAASTVEALVDEQVRKMLDAGHPIRSEAAFRADWRRRILAQDRATPGFLDNARRRLSGERCTRCREVRGTHGISHVYDPDGTDPPPPWWNEDEARRLADRSIDQPRAGDLPGLGDST